MCSQWIGGVSVSDEAELFRKLLEVTESHAHGEDAGTDTPVIGYLVTENGTGYGIHNEPDISFYAADFDIGFISNHCVGSLVIVVIYERFDYKGCGSGIVGNLLVGDLNPIQVIQSLCGFTERQLEIHMECEAERHDMGIMLGEFQRGSILRQGV